MTFLTKDKKLEGVLFIFYFYGLEVNKEHLTYKVIKELPETRESSQSYSRHRVVIDSS